MEQKLQTGGRWRQANDTVKVTVKRGDVLKKVWDTSGKCLG